MKPLNYCYEFKNAVTKKLRSYIKTRERTNIRRTEKRNLLEHLIERMRALSVRLDKSVKYILPENGIVFEDRTYQYLKDKTIKLPYPKIALEFRTAQGVKTILLIAHASDDEKVIVVHTFYYSTKDNDWEEPPVLVFSADNPIRRAADNSLTINGLSFTAENASDMSLCVSSAFTVIGFLNALYSNKTINTPCKPVVLSSAKHSDKSKKKSEERSDADYKYVYITLPKVIKVSNCEKIEREVGDRFRPREHIRKGHFRHYKSGKEAWIPGNVINKGVGKSVEKIYVVIPGETK